MTEDIEQLPLPTDWSFSPIEAICEKPQYGLTESASTQPIGPRFLRITDIDEGQVNWPSVPFCKCPDTDIPRYRLANNDILFARIGATTGKSFIVKNPPDAVFASYLIRLRTTKAVSPDFLFFFFNSALYWSQVNANKFATLKGGINGSILSKLQVVIPTLPEQNKIAAVLWKIQQAIEVEAGLARCTRDLKKVTMRQLFTAGLRGDAQKTTQFSEVPESWKIEVLSSCAYVQTGATKGREIPAEQVLEVPYLRVANVQDGHLDLSEMKTIRIRKTELDGLLLRPDDVVLTEGGDFDKLGRGFIWEGQIDPCVHQNHIFAVRVNREKLLPRYFAYLAQSHYGRAYFLSVAHKTTNLACINTTKLRAFPVLVPELDEQKEITEILDTLDRKIGVHEAKQRAWQDLFKTMLQKLMTAQIRVNDLDIDTREIEA
jgi:type I restriction enzyme, S subunit